MPSAASPALDRNDVRFSLAVACEGTLARAATVLGVDRTTMGRRIASLEDRLKIALFPAGSGVLEPAQRTRPSADDRVACRKLADFALRLYASRSTLHPRDVCVSITLFNRRLGCKMTVSVFDVHPNVVSRA